MIVVKAEQSATIQPTFNIKIPMKILVTKNGRQI